MDLVQVLGFLFMLGTLQLGKVGPIDPFDAEERDLIAGTMQAYTTSGLTQTQVQLLSDLADYGLVYRQNVRPRPLTLL